MEIRSLEPLSFSDYIFPGDRVAIVPDKTLAQKESVLAEMILRVLQLGVSLEDISLILTEKEHKEKADAIRRTLHEKRPEKSLEQISEQLCLIAHQPGNRKEIGHLGASVRGEPIGLCRAIVDADFVLPLGCVPANSRSGYYGLLSGIFPRFSDQETQMRFAEAESGRMTLPQKKKLTAEVEEAAILLGILFTIQRVGKHWICGSPKSCEAFVKARKNRSRKSTP